MLVVGVDENGLGPGLGPLVVTAIVLEVPDVGEDALRLDRHGLPASVADSKLVFKRTVRSYATGEAVALALAGALLAACEGRHVSGFLAALTRGACALAREGAPPELHHAELPVPIWGGDPAPIEAALAAAGIRVVDVACRVLFPAEFNCARTGPGGKLALNYRIFEEALGLLAARPPLALLGKIGGTRFYRPWLDASARLSDVETLEEEPAESRYRTRFGDAPLELRFVRDGDGTYLPIAAASLVGKYVREASMLCLNRALGFDAPIPHASGYWSDPKTHLAIERFEERFARTVPRSAFLRDG